jgi:hypothetical protein
MGHRDGICGDKRLTSATTQAGYPRAEGNISQLGESMAENRLEGGKDFTKAEATVLNPLLFHPSDDLHEKYVRVVGFACGNYFSKLIGLQPT